MPLVIGITFTMVSFFIVGLSLYSDPWNTGQSCALTLTGVPVYYVTVYRFRLPRRCRRIFGKLYQYSSSECINMIVFVMGLNLVALFLILNLGIFGTVSNDHICLLVFVKKEEDEWNRETQLLVVNKLILTFLNSPRLLQQTATDPSRSGSTGSPHLLKTQEPSCILLADYTDTTWTKH